MEMREALIVFEEGVFFMANPDLPEIHLSRQCVAFLVHQ